MIFGEEGSTLCLLGRAAERGRAELGRCLLEAATSLCQLGPRGEWVIRSPQLQRAGTWALSIIPALDEAQRDTGASNEMWLCCYRQG